MTDDDYKFSLAGIRKKTKGTDKHSDLIKNQINMLEAIILTIKEVSKYGTERQINDENKISKKLNDLSLSLFGEEISSKQKLIEKIKNENFSKDSLEEFLFELSKEKVSIDNPSYLKN